MEKLTEKQFDALKSLKFPYETGEFKAIGGIFPKILLIDLIIYKLKEVFQLQNTIKSNELNYTSKREKTYSFSEYALSIVF